MKNTVLLEIKGKNLERFLHRITTHGVEILWLKEKKKSIEIKVSQKDYETILKLKSIYEVTLLDTFGFLKIKKKVNQYKVFLFTLFLGILTLVFLSHIIFRIEVIHNDKTLRTLLLKELESYGIQKYTFKKNFKELEKIKQEILEKQKDKIEWLEIETIGTKYEIRVEERKQKEEEKQTEPRNLVAKKDATIKEIHAETGEIIKNIHDYVKKGDIIVSGIITLNDTLKNITSAKGTVYGEVWYQTKVEYPFYYQEHFLTGKKKTVYTFHFFNFKLSFFHPFSNKQVEEQVLWKHSYLPISITKEYEKEERVIENIYTEEEAILKAEELGRKQMELKLKEGEEILAQKNLKVTVKESKIEVDLFFTVKEDITSYQKIEPTIEGE